MPEGFSDRVSEADAWVDGVRVAGTEIIYDLS